MKSAHLIIQDLISPELFRERGEAAWELIDSRLVLTLDQIWDATGPFVVNDWHQGGKYKESGLRSWGSATGAPLSQHKFGRAADVKSRLMRTKDLHEFLLANASKFPFLTTLEDVHSTPTWVHVDCRNNQTAGVRVVKP